MVATLARVTVMSALPPKADMCGATRDVRFVPIADMCGALVHVCSRPEAVGNIAQRWWTKTAGNTNDFES